MAVTYNRRAGYGCPFFLRRRDMRKINITAGSVEMTATLNDSKTANLLWDTLPAANGARVGWFSQPRP